MAIKLFDSELKIMEVLWREDDLTAKQISAILNAEIGWNQNTTYTVIKKCIAKGAIERRDPHFICHALVSKAEVRSAEAHALMDKLFDGSPEILFASLLEGTSLSREQIDRLHALVERLK